MIEIGGLAEVLKSSGNYAISCNLGFKEGYSKREGKIIFYLSGCGVM